MALERYRRLRNFSRTPEPDGTRTGGGRAGTVRFTHLSKLMFPQAGFRKEDIVRYYQSVSGFLLPYLRGRPITLERLPEGVAGGGAPHFWQKNTPKSYPAWIPRMEIPTESGRPVDYVLINHLDVLLYLVNQGALTFHIWLSQLEDLDRPDFVLFDLDPGEARFGATVAVARELHSVLERGGVPAYVKTSGKSGIHVLVPWRARGGYGDSREWALSVARRIVRAAPKLATIERSKSKRQGRVYVDVMQNARGHHVVPPYVIRAVPEAAVSTPLEWDELDERLDPRSFNIRTVPERIEEKRFDPMAELLSFGGAAEERRAA